MCVIKGGGELQYKDLDAHCSVSAKQDSNYIAFRASDNPWLLGLCDLTSCICILSEYTKHFIYMSKPSSTEHAFLFLIQQNDFLHFCLYFISRSGFPPICTQVQDPRSYTNPVSLVGY